MVGPPTSVQEAAWAEISTGRNALVMAPTGSGKTLAAFLWSLDRLLSGHWAEGQVRVLYISPLKALNNDIQRNLLVPLAELQERFARAQPDTPSVRVMTRSGDTPGNERQKMVRRPPEILITTPESLNILLASRGGRSMLSGLHSVILDEIHAVAATKRGTHLITAVDRLVRLSGDFQRVALSATIRPLERIARFVGGWQMETLGETPTYRRRPVSIVKSDDVKRYEIEVAYPAADEWRTLRGQASSLDGNTVVDTIAPPDTIWDHLRRDFKDRIRSNRSTLLFANSRRTTEKVARLLNENERPELAYSHHGSLSREIRSVVEQRLKDGRLAAIVATNSLELGIDIGALDEVLLVQTPPTVASAVQRIGRAGHGVGETSRGRLYPLFGRDFLDAAVMARSIHEGAIEEVHPIRDPLDVLAQIVLAMTAIEPWDIDDLHDALRTSEPYHDLSRRKFDLVLEMLAGRYAASRIRELEPRISIDRVENTVTARPGSLHKIYLSGGTIPDRGYFHLRREGSMAKIGELDEEFVWERSLGDTFTLGAQHWRVKQITHNDVVVAPAASAASMAPFWRAEEHNRSFHLSARIGEVLEEAEANLAVPRGGNTLRDRLVDGYSMTSDAADYLVDLLVRQRAATGTALPHRHHLVVEQVTDGEAAPASGDDREHFLLHTFWGGRINRPLATALAGAWERAHDIPLEIENDNDCILLIVPRGVAVEDVLGLIRPDNVESLLRERLERTGFFGARFRENAGRALLLPRSDLKRRIPLWLTRERAKKLFESIDKTGDFPILLETWRTCLHDEFDLESLRQILGELDSGAIRVSHAKTATASPFGAGLIWKQTNRLMYEGDASESRGPGLRHDLLQELVYSSSLRPRLPANLLDRFQRKLHRTYTGYTPRTPSGLADWVHERLALPTTEWSELLTAIERDLDEVDIPTWLDESRTRITRARFGGRAASQQQGGAEQGEFIASLESVVRMERALGEEADLLPLSAGMSTAHREIEIVRDALSDAEGPSLVELASEWFRHYGPIDQEIFAETFHVEESVCRSILGELVELETVVIDRFRDTDGGETVESPASEAPLEVCDAENLERLLRLLRAESRSQIEARSIDELPLFLATVQGVVDSGDGVDSLRDSLETLFGYPAAAGLWESDILPARLSPYYPAWLDSIMLESSLTWIGCGNERLTFAFEDEVELLAELTAELGDAEGRDDSRGLLPDPRGRFSLEEIARHTGRSTAAATRELWQAAWSGALSNTTFAAVRRGILGRFEPSASSDRPAEDARSFTAVPGQGRGRRTSPGSRPRGNRPSGSGRRAFSRWQSSRPFAGDWFAIEAPDLEAYDALDIEELNRERVRLLLDRYGVLFRELLERELPALRWRRLFRSLRLMELSGEVVAGHYFDGVQGLQFASPAAARRLRDGYRSDVIYWLNGCDPASPCGLGLETLKGTLPPRLPSTHLVFHGAKIVVISRRSGSELDIRVEPQHPHLAEYFGFLKALLSRHFNPVKSIDLEVINGVPATTSPYVEPIATAFHTTREHRCVRLRKTYS